MASKQQYRHAEVKQFKFTGNNLNIEDAVRGGAITRAASPYGRNRGQVGVEAVDPNENIRDGRLSAIANRSPEAIERERDFKKFRDRLEDVFSQIDKDKNDRLDRGEIYRHLKSQLMQSQQSADNEAPQRDEAEVERIVNEITEYLFKTLDPNGNRTIEKEEILEVYVQEYRKEIELINETQLMIQDQNVRLAQLEQRIQEEHPLEQNKLSNHMHPHPDRARNTRIVKDSALYIRVMDGRGFGEMRKSFQWRSPEATLVRCLLVNSNGQDGMSLKTSEVTEDVDNPVFDENIVLDVENGQEKVRIELYDIVGVKKQLRGSFVFDLTLFTQEKIEQFSPDYNIDQMPLDYAFQLNQDGIEDEAMGELHVQLQWIYSKVTLLKDLRDELKGDIDYNKNEFLRERLEALEKLSSPLGLLGHQVLKGIDEDGLELKKDDITAVFGRDIYPMEEDLERKIGKFIPGQAGLGAKPGNFHYVTRTLTFIFLFITILVLFYKADFVNLTVCMLAMYQLEMIGVSPVPTDTRRGHFRMLVAMILLSLIYDFIWLWLRTKDVGDLDNGDGGGVEAKIRSFSLFWTYISIVAKVIMALVYWKTSLNFNKFLAEVKK